MAKGQLKYNISNWSQLSQCLSNISNEYHIRTRKATADKLSGTVIEVYHDRLGSLFTYLVDADGDLIDSRDSGHPDFTVSELLDELSRFGFIVTYNRKAYLSEGQLNYLKTLVGLGFDKLRLLYVYKYTNNGLRVSQPHLVAFNIEKNPGWMDITYSASITEFDNSLENGSAIDLDDVSESHKYRWDWLDYVANIQDILDDNTKPDPPGRSTYTKEEIDKKLEDIQSEFEEELSVKVTCYEGDIEPISKPDEYPGIKSGDIYIYHKSDNNIIQYVATMLDNDIIHWDIDGKIDDSIISLSHTYSSQHIENIVQDVLDKSADVISQSIADTMSLIEDARDCQVSNLRIYGNSFFHVSTGKQVFDIVNSEGKLYKCRGSFPATGDSYTVGQLQQDADSPLQMQFQKSSEGYTISTVLNCNELNLNRYAYSSGGGAYEFVLEDAGIYNTEAKYMLSIDDVQIFHNLDSIISDRVTIDLDRPIIDYQYATSSGYYSHSESLSYNDIKQGKKTLYINCPKYTPYGSIYIRVYVPTFRCPRYINNDLFLEKLYAQFNIYGLMIQKVEAEYSTLQSWEPYTNKLPAPTQSNPCYFNQSIGLDTLDNLTKISNDEVIEYNSFSPASAEHKRIKEGVQVVNSEYEYQGCFQIPEEVTDEHKYLEIEFTGDISELRFENERDHRIMWLTWQGREFTFQSVDGLYFPVSTDTLSGENKKIVKIDLDASGLQYLPGDYIHLHASKGYDGPLYYNLWSVRLVTSSYGTKTLQLSQDKKDKTGKQYVSGEYSYQGGFNINVDSQVYVDSVNSSYKYLEFDYTGEGDILKGLRFLFVDGLGKISDPIWFDESQLAHFYNNGSKISPPTGNIQHAKISWESQIFEPSKGIQGIHIHASNDCIGKITFSNVRFTHYGNYDSRPISIPALSTIEVKQGQTDTYKGWFPTEKIVEPRFKYMRLTYSGNIHSLRLEGYGKTMWFRDNEEGTFKTADGSTIDTNPGNGEATIVIDLIKSGVLYGYSDFIHLHAGEGTSFWYEFKKVELLTQSPLVDQNAVSLQLEQDDLQILGADCTQINNLYKQTRLPYADYLYHNDLADRYCDYFDSTTNKLHKRIHTLVLDGSEDELWEKDRSTYYKSQLLRNAYGLANRDIVIISCSHFKPDNISDGSFYTEQSTLEAWLEWLHNNPVTIQYFDMKNEEIIDVVSDVPELQFKQGVNNGVIISNGFGLKYKYLATTKTYIDDAIDSKRKYVDDNYLLASDYNKYNVELESQSSSSSSNTKIWRFRTDEVHTRLDLRDDTLGLMYYLHSRFIPFEYGRADLYLTVTGVFNGSGMSPYVVYLDKDLLPIKSESLNISSVNSYVTVYCYNCPRNTKYVCFIDPPGSNIAYEFELRSYLVHQNMWTMFNIDSELYRLQQQLNTKYLRLCDDTTIRSVEYKNMKPYYHEAAVKFGSVSFNYYTDLFACNIGQPGVQSPSIKITSLADVVTSGSGYKYCIIAFFDEDGKQIYQNNSPSYYKLSISNKKVGDYVYITSTVQDIIRKMYPRVKYLAIASSDNYRPEFEFVVNQSVNEITLNPDNIMLKEDIQELVDAKTDTGITSEDIDKICV